MGDDRENSAACRLREVRGLRGSLAGTRGLVSDATVPRVRTVILGLEEKGENMRKSQKESDVPRPACGVCGGLAGFQVDLQIRELELERDGGMKSQPYWMPSYRRTVQSVATTLCKDCLAVRVNVTLDVAATVVGTERR